MVSGVRSPEGRGANGAEAEGASESRDGAVQAGNPALAANKSADVRRAEERLVDVIILHSLDGYMRLKAGVSTSGAI